MHFFNPAPIMKLVEVVSTVSTADDVAETTRALCAKVGKVAVSCGDRAGFIVNALLFPYLNDAVKMLEAHYATADDIDTAMKYGCALPMGPFELLDVVGNDVSLAIQRELYLEFREPGFAPAPLLEHLVTAGYLGRKTQRGFRDYTRPLTRSRTTLPVRTSRLEAFSDGVLAIIITIMVLELHVPEEHDPARRSATRPTGFLTYALSFVYIGIYWNNHHHMFQVVETITGGVLWANLHLLFWLSLLPFTTAWMDETRLRAHPDRRLRRQPAARRRSPTTSLQLTIFRGPGGDRLREALGRGPQGQAVAGDLPRRHPARASCARGSGCGVYVAVAVIWLVPDRRIERYLAPETRPRERRPRRDLGARSTSCGGSPARPPPSPTAARAATR